MSRKNILWLAGIIGMALLAFVSYRVGARTNNMSDFNVFWQAGENYGDGVSLYKQIGGACRYIYPPFAAMLFRVLALFNMQTAASIWCFVNFLLWFGIFYYIRTLLRLCNISKRNITISLWAGVILSARYFLYHITFIQMNELVMLMSLAGVKALIEKKEPKAMGLLVVATFIKIIPVFLLLWALTKTKLRGYLFAAVFALLCLGLPILMRGPAKGVNDIKEYVQTFLGPAVNGNVEVDVENQGIVSALYKVFTVNECATKYGYFIKELPAATLQIISRSLLVLCYAAYASVLFYSRFKWKAISALEVSFIMLFTLLVTSVSWEYHYVSMGFVFTILMAQYLSATKEQRSILYPLLGIVFIVDIIGASTVGFDLFYKSCGYSFVTLLALVMAVFHFYCLFSKSRNYPVFNTPTT